MSTALKLKPSSLPSTPVQCGTQSLLAATAIRADDRVAVIGPGAFDHLPGLARSGCKRAVALRSASFGRREMGAADVIWFTGVETIGADLHAAIEYLETSRIVVMELARDGAKAGLALFLGQLRAKGLADQTVSKAAGRTLMVASRPAWLRCVI